MVTNNIGKLKPKWLLTRLKYFLLWLELQAEQTSAEQAAKKKRYGIPATYLKEFPWPNYHASREKLFLQCYCKARK